MRESEERERERAVTCTYVLTTQASWPMKNVHQQNRSSPPFPDPLKASSTKGEPIFPLSHILSLTFKAPDTQVSSLQEDSPPGATTANNKRTSSLPSLASISSPSFFLSYIQHLSITCITLDSKAPGQEEARNKTTHFEFSSSLSRTSELRHVVVAPHAFYQARLLVRPCRYPVGDGEGHGEGHFEGCELWREVLFHQWKEGDYLLRFNSLSTQHARGPFLSK